MEEVCQYGKYGFCKFKEICNRKHYTQICENLSGCKDTKKCHKRHPKDCKRFVSDSGCRFNSECAYNHRTVEEDGEKKMFKDKVSELEKMVKALSRKVLSLESEIEYIKNNKIITLGVENIKLSEIIEENKETATEEVIIENSGSDMNSFDDSEIKLKCSTPKESQNKVKKTSKDDLISCGQ